MNFPFQAVFLSFTGIILQAFPFLLAGTLISSVIQIFISETFIEKHFPKSTFKSFLFAIFGGFCLPVCDCVSVPVFKTLIKKGVPLQASIVFMLVSPVINPVVIASTYYAFAGNMKAVLSRICIGTIACIITGLTFYIKSPLSVLPSYRNTLGKSFSLGKNTLKNDEESQKNKNSSDSTSFLRKISSVFELAKREFFGVSVYLITGALISSVIQPFSSSLTSLNHSMTARILVMLFLAFALSLCSSSDAVVSKTFLNQFGFAPVLGFLIFGPMMDVKNFLMLWGTISGKFAVRLAVTSFAVCFAVTAIFSLLTEGGIL